MKINELTVFKETRSILINDQIETLKNDLLSELKGKYEVAGEIKPVIIFIENQGKILISAIAGKADGSEISQSEALFLLR